MFPAILTTFLWGICSVAARRSAEQLGSNAANALRLAIALVALGIVAHVWGAGLGGTGVWIIILSGIFGFGIGDIGMFYALPKLGTRMTVLVAQCGAVPVAGFIEWAWLGTTLSWSQIGAIAVILSGLILALFPEKRLGEMHGKVFWAGLIAAIIAMLGQGTGTVLGRIGYLQSEAGGHPAFDLSQGGVWAAILVGATLGYQRIVGGLPTVLLFMGLKRAFARGPQEKPPRAGDSIQSKIGWNFGHALTGPILGISCFQWALAVQPSAVVQPIIAMTPIVIMPLAYFIEGDRPSPRAILGSFIAVGGVIWLAIG